MELQEDLRDLGVPHSGEGEEDHTEPMHSRGSHTHHTGTPTHCIHCRPGDDLEVTLSSLAVQISGWLCGGICISAGDVCLR